MCSKLGKTKYTNYKIILVDNNSEDRNKLKTDLFLNQSCDVILSEANNGFAAGNNIGIKYAEESIVRTIIGY